MPLRPLYGPWACPRCGETDESKRSGRGALKCRPCTAEAAREWRSNHLEYARAADRRNREKKMAARRLRTYGLDVDAMEALLLRQEGQCAICRVAMKSKGSKKDNYLNVDHDHATGSVRGLLCGRCNRVLGNMEDNSDLLMAAALYLEAFKIRLEQVQGVV